MEWQWSASLETAEGEEVRVRADVSELECDGASGGIERIEGIEQTA